MILSGQHHVPATGTHLTGGLGSSTGVDIWRRSKCLNTAGYQNPYFLARSLVTIVTEQSRLIHLPDTDAWDPSDEVSVN
jgi:hypothetical protein